MLVIFILENLEILLDMFIRRLYFFHENAKKLSNAFTKCNSALNHDTSIYHIISLHLELHFILRNLYYK